MTATRKLLLQGIGVACLGIVVLSRPAPAYARTENESACGVCDYSADRCGPSGFDFRSQYCDELCHTVLTSVCDSPVDYWHCGNDVISSWDCK
jgi:hypothetical protein